MKLEGSCHCGSIHFSLESKTPYPYMRCYCSVCRKTTGGGGYAINLMAEAESLEIHDPHRVRKIYQAEFESGISPAERSFCGTCGSHLWLWDPRWPDLIHPLAAAIDTPLPKTPETVHIMLESKPDWVELPSGDTEICFQVYPELSIEDWHKQKHLYGSDTP